MGKCVDDEHVYTQGVVAKHTETQNRQRHKGYLQPYIKKIKQYKGRLL